MWHTYVGNLSLRLKNCTEKMLFRQSHIILVFHYASIQQTLLAQVYQVQLDTHIRVDHHLKDLETHREEINGMK